MTDVRIRVLVVLLAVTGSACAAHGGVPRPFPGASIPPTARKTPQERGGLFSNAVQAALGFLGTPYRNGGTDPTGFDCSGFVQYIYAQIGAVLPREVKDQFRAGREIDLKEVKPGDLLFFHTVAPGASHVGMALGDGRFVHAPSSRGVVRVEPYTANYWARRFVGARRVTGAPLVNASAEPAVFPGAIRTHR